MPGNRRKFEEKTPIWPTKVDIWLLIYIFMVVFVAGMMIEAHP